MNLHGVVRGVITAIVPDQIGTVQISTGATNNPDGSQTPTYNTFNNVRMQVQALSGRDLRQLDGVNLAGTVLAVYLFGTVASLVRDKDKGGDLITLYGAYAGVYLITQILEPWSAVGWTKACMTRQNGS